MRFRIGRWRLSVGQPAPRVFRGWTFSFFCSPNNRSHRHLHDLGRRRSTMHLLPHPVAAIFRFDDRLIKKAPKIIDVLIGTQNHVAAAAAVAAIRSAFRHKFLPPKTHTTTLAIAGLRKDFDSIDKHSLEDVKIVAPLNRHNVDAIIVYEHKTIPPDNSGAPRSVFLLFLGRNAGDAYARNRNRA